LRFTESKPKTQAVSLARRTRDRITRRLIPFLMLSYLLAYLDRANLAVAKLQMQTDLKLTDAVIGFGAGIFFLGYFLLEIPGALLVEHWSASKWMARIMISWGIVAAFTGCIGMAPLHGLSVTHQFYAARLLLGAAEAGFFPGIIVYLSHWFRSEDRPRAKAYFMMTQPLAIVIGVPLSRWILETVHWFGLAGWRWVFILEGAPCVLLGFVTLFYLTDRPLLASWLPAEEKLWLASELQAEMRERKAARRVRLREAFQNPQVFLLIAVYVLIVSGNQALIFFFPSITNQMTRMSVTARTVVATLPYLCSMAGILLNGFSAHRSRERRWHTAAPMLIAGCALGCAVLSGDHLALAIAFFCLAGAASQAYLPVFWTLPSAFFGSSAAAASTGLINSVGNLGGFFGPDVFGYLRTASGSYRAGLWFLVACTLSAGILATAIRVPQKPRGNNRNESHASQTQT
jgi:ACS family tartrate transporter-like MFS transporter